MFPMYPLQKPGVPIPNRQSKPPTPGYLTHHFPSGLAKQSLNFEFTTKMVFPKSLKSMNSGSEILGVGRGTLKPFCAPLVGWIGMDYARVPLETFLTHVATEATAQLTTLPGCLSGSFQLIPCQNQKNEETRNPKTSSWPIGPPLAGRAQPHGRAWAPGHTSASMDDIFDLPLLVYKGICHWNKSVGTGPCMKRGCLSQGLGHGLELPHLRSGV